MRPTVESRLAFDNKLIENRGPRRIAERCHGWKSLYNGRRRLVGEGSSRSRRIRHRLLNAALLSQNLATPGPRDPEFRELKAVFSRCRKYTFWLKHFVTARAGACPPRIASRQITARILFETAGFSLIEMLVVVTIIAAIAALITTAVMSALQQQNARVCQNNMLTIEAAKDEYIRDHPGATSINQSAFAQYFRFGIPKCPDNGNYQFMYNLTQQVVCSKHGAIQGFPSPTP